MKVAEILYARFVAQMPRKKLTPSSVVAFLQSHSPEEVQKLGISRQKRGYLLDLAKHFDEGKIPTRRFAKMSDQEIIDCLTQVKGIGRWTAEMFLMFNLNRPDVLPVDDLGLKKGFMKAFSWRTLPKGARMTKHARAWSPWRTIATWYLWRHLEVKK